MAGDPGGTGPAVGERGCSRRTQVLEAPGEQSPALCPSFCPSSGRRPELGSV